MAARDQMDPEVAEAVGAFPTLDFATTGFVTVRDYLRETARQAAAGRKPTPDVRSEDHSVPGPAGDPEVVVRVYRPVGPAAGPGGALPCLYWIHGGGYVIGSYDMNDERLEQIAAARRCVVVSVEYRLAPEHPYPAPLEDCYAGLVWTARQAASLGIDPARMVIGGQSAGGGLAAALALLARDRDEVTVSYQLLIYPMLDDRAVTPSSGQDTVIWTKEANHLGWAAYLGPLSGSVDVPPYAAPARATELAGLPPAFVGVGTLDLFRDENIAYAARLLGAGVRTELHVYPAVPHAFESLAPAAAVSRRFIEAIDAALEAALHPSV